MCKSPAEGGQRCYSHARKALDAALAAKERVAPLDVLRALGAPDPLPPYTRRALDGRILRAQLDLASTPRGREELLATATAARVRHDEPTAERIEQLVERGLILQERNTALKTLNHRDKWGYKAPQKATGSLTLSAQQIREYLARGLTPEQAAGACRDLTATLRTLNKASGQRSRITTSDPTTGLLDEDETASETARLAHERAALSRAEYRWRTITSDPDIDDTTAWREFIDQTRHARDHIPNNIAFTDNYRRDNNFILRVCGEIAYEHTR